MNNSSMFNSEYSFVHSIDRLSKGRSVTLDPYGTVKCTTKGVRPRKFSVSGSKVAHNRGGYTFSTLMKEFDLHR